MLGQCFRLFYSYLDDAGAKDTLSQADFFSC